MIRVSLITSRSGAALILSGAMLSGAIGLLNNLNDICKRRSRRMRKMRKFSKYVLLILVLVLAGCGGAAPQANQASPTSVKKSTPTPGPLKGNKVQFKTSDNMVLDGTLYGE